MPREGHQACARATSSGGTWRPRCPRESLFESRLAIFGRPPHIPSSPPGSFVTVVNSSLADALRDRYVLERELGRGGMATVYLARDLRHDRHVALKVVLPELGAVLGPDRFLGEIRVTAHLQHPNLLPLFDSGAADGHLWYTMPFIEGESLRA